MSSRLNPRDYDIEELRAAFQANRGENREPVGEEALEQQYVPQSDSERAALERDGKWLTAGDTCAQRTQKPVKNATDGGHPEKARGQADRGHSEATASMHEADEGRSQARPLPTADSDDPDVLPLTQIPTAYTAQQEILDWMDGLLSASGPQGTMEALKYYEAIGWLSPECRDQLEKFAEGLRTAGCTDSRPLVIDDHRESLQYIATLARCQ
ncbi:hypothetical protein HWV07_00600 [Natronomonas salina]|uniref:FlaD/FlaE family flagellar protein n=1 Tax=Natronomonas salina TaxID=1710540 RepID=UPI0015B6716D|nr:FlaD/FlaE family flagellar protein [Natronomonas salina]QLD87612.1 hypothetical protein HWV07_00600 [Natronomonas salina]